MKRVTSILLFATLVLIFSSCSQQQRRGHWGYGPRPHSIYSSRAYDDAPGGWDVYKGRGSTRVKYSE